MNRGVLSWKAFEMNYSLGNLNFIVLSIYIGLPTMFLYEPFGIFTDFTSLICGCRYFTCKVFGEEINDKSSKRKVMSKYSSISICFIFNFTIM